MFKPYFQFVCDSCGRIIYCPEDGRVEWIQDLKAKGSAHSFRIVHDIRWGPRGLIRGCYPSEAKQGYASIALKNVLTDPVAKLLAHIKVDQYFEPTEDCRQRMDTYGFCDLIRRLNLPYYEAARLYFHRANADGFFKGMGVVDVLSPTILMKLIKNYSGGAKTQSVLSLS